VLTAGTNHVISQSLQILKNAQVTGGQLPAAPGPQDVHPTAYASAVVPPPGLTGPPVLLQTTLTRPTIFRLQSSAPPGDNHHLPPPAAAPTSRITSKLSASWCRQQAIRLNFRVCKFCYHLSLSSHPSLIEMSMENREMVENVITDYGMDTEPLVHARLSFCIHTVAEWYRDSILDIISVLKGPLLFFHEIKHMLSLLCAKATKRL